jgi:hypothetical protein
MIYEKWIYQVLVPYWLKTIGHSENALVTPSTVDHYHYEVKQLSWMVEDASPQSKAVRNIAVSIADRVSQDYMSKLNVRDAADLLTEYRIYKHPDAASLVMNAIQCAALKLLPDYPIQQYSRLVEGLERELGLLLARSPVAPSLEDLNNPLSPVWEGLNA